MHNKDIKLIALDMDGTTLRENKTVSPRTLRAIKTLINRNIYIVPATGRPVKNLIGKTLDVTGIRFAITSNGARLTDMIKAEDLLRCYLSPDDAAYVIRHLSGFDAYIYAHSDDENLHGVDPYGRFSEIFPHIKFHGDSKTDLAAYILEKRPSIQKIGVLAFDNKTYQHILSETEVFQHVNMTSTGPQNIEFNSLAASKGNALKQLCEMLEIQKERVLAIGDNGNDRSMMEFAGYSVAMGNAADEIKALADEVTLSNEEDGVAIFLERFFQLI